MLFNWLGEMLGLNDIRQRLDKLESRVSSLEDSTAFILKDFGDYKNRTNAELNLMESQISRLLAQIEDILSTLDNAEGIDRAITLRRRLRNNHTRIVNILEARVG